MKRINYLVMLAAAALMAGFGPKVEQTVLVGHFHNTDDVPEYVILFNEAAWRLTLPLPVNCVTTASN